MLKITQILRQSRKSNLILVGEPGVGKTRIVEGFAQLLAEGKLPDALGRPAVRRLDILVHQANGWRKKSSFASRFSLFIGTWARRPRSLKARGAIRVIGATTIREYRQTIEMDGALERSDSGFSG